MRRLGPAAGLLGVAATAVVLSACGGSSAPSTANVGSSGSTGSSTSGGDGGTLNWASSAPTSWDPVTSAAGNDVTNLSLVYEALTRLGPTGDAGPGLATRWSFSRDGRTFTMTLRGGIRFSDGTPFDAQAVRTNLDRGEHESDSLIAPQLTVIRSIDVVSPTVIRLHLSAQDYGLPLVLGGKTGMMVSPRALSTNVKGLATKPVGAGPFTLTSYVPDGQATLVKNPGYWDARDIHLAGVNLKFIADPQAVLSALQSGQVQLALIPGTQVSAARSAGLTVDQFPSLHVASIEVNDKIRPFDNPQFVQAVNYAIDRRALVQTLAGGYGTADDEPFPPNYVGYEPSVANYYSHDPARAKALLRQSGYDGTPVTITWFQAPTLDYQAESEQLQAQLAAVGIKASIKSAPAAEAAALVYVRHTVAFNPNGIVGRESPLQMLNIQYAANGLLNPGRDATPALTQALAEVARYPLDDPRYAPALRAATAQAVRDSPNIMLFTQPFIFARTSKLTGLKGYIVSPRLEGVRLAK